ncbi:hypothetical protein [Isoptericola cucumis]|uniref:hypothetical protein n=1 Tax=Isoptericola cucumis TaxID=1776856 RepID=UPI001665FEB4|nr:hypothetical protein [Isoptericola cucumis]
MQISASCSGKRIGDRVARGVWSRAIGGGLAFSLVVTLVAVPASADVVQDADDPPAGAVECMPEVETIDEAVQVAVACGEDILAADESTEWSTSYATASGDLQVDYTATAVRQDSDGDGQWAPVDVTVSDAPTTEAVDGVPAGMLEVSGGVEPIWLNPGGAGGADLPLAIMGDSDERVAMYSQSLPITGPVTVEDERVSYDLGGGVTMVVTVNAEGSMVTPVVRVGDEAALAHLHEELLVGEGGAPAALSLSFPLEVSAGLQVAQTAVGFAVRDSAGEVAFESGPVLMWDSAGALDWDDVGTADGAPSTARKTVSTDESGGGDPSGAAAEGDRLAAPATGDGVHPMDVAVNGDVVVVSPDPQVLADPALEFPLHLDPSIGSGTPGRWATVRSRWPSNTYWKPSDAQAVGFCDVSRAPECGGDSKDRLFWHYRLP